MNLLLLSAYFPPDTGSAAHLFYELGTALVERGHGVTVVTGMPGYHAQGSLARYEGRRWMREEMNGMEVIRVAAPQFPRHLMLGRALWQFGAAAAFFPTSLCLRRPDIMMVYSPPLPLGLTAWVLKQFWRTPFVLNVQDLFPQSIIDLNLLRSAPLIRLFEQMERFVYRRADAITVHSQGNRRHVQAKGASKDKVRVIPNWVDADFIRPSIRMNGFRKEQGLDDAFIVSFAGVLGYSQDLDIILKAAALTEDAGDIVWLIVGDGVEKPRLEEEARQKGLTHVRFLPMQPRDRYPAVLHASDVCLATLHPEVKTPVVPSKILSIMAAGRPVVAAMDLEGDAPKLINDAGCGLCVTPGDQHGMADAVTRLYGDAALRERLGHDGRRYIETNLTLNASVDRYEALFNDLM